jgi:hypothetical protein
MNKPANDATGHVIEPDDYADILSDREIDDIRWIIRRLWEYGREANGALDKADEDRCNRVEEALQRMERDDYVADPPTNVDQLRERNALAIAHNILTHCVHCGGIESAHIGEYLRCPILHSPNYAPVWTPGRVPENPDLPNPSRQETQ